MKRFLILILLASLLAACLPAQAPASTAVPRFEKAECPFIKPAGAKVECGYLVVPENRAKADGKTIRLAVAIFKTANPNPRPDPILYLEGGPGGSPLRAYPEYYSLLLEPLLKNRDLILLDQRGTGYSEPALDCPAANQLNFDLLDSTKSPQEKEKELNQAFIDCRNDLAARGIDLSAYNSHENAADVADLRKTLGYAEWNLYGISYGTRLALTVMRDFPEGTRSVILDSVYPPEYSLTIDPPRNADRAFDLMFDTCAADPACAAAYPNLRQTFFDFVKELDASPARVPVTLPDGTRKEMVFTGADLINFVFQSMYATTILPSLPQIITAARRGNFVVVSSINSQFLKSAADMSRGMFFSVECVEDVPFDDPGEVRRVLESLPEYGDAFGSPEGTFEICKAWDVQKAGEIETRPVASDIPTLVFGGQFDPITPPAWAKETASRLSRSFYFELPGAGHGASLTETCPREMLLAFLDDPTRSPDAGCIAAQMAGFAFFTPLSSVEVRLIPFEDPTFALAGKRPEAWSPAMSGVYSPSGQLTDNTQLLIQAAPQPIETLLNSLTANLRSQGISLEKGEAARTLNGIEWSFYTADAGTAYIDLALGKYGDRTFLVLLQVPAASRDAYRSAVFLPVVESIQPR